MTAQITQHADGFSVQDGVTGADYSEVRFTQQAAERVADLIDGGTPDWDDIEPLLEADGIQILAEVAV